MYWTERILAFPVRTAAVDAFLSELKTKRSADLNAVMATLNEGSLCRAALQHWVVNGWIVVAPHSPLLAMAGPAFKPELTLRAFCGEPIEIEELEAPASSPASLEQPAPSASKKEETEE